MKQLVINADDFGTSPGVNKGIIQAFKEGILTSTSIVTNLKYYNDAVKLWKRNKSLGIGIHVNLMVNPLPIFISKLFLGRISKENIEKEVESQVQKAISNIGSLDHIDSHRYVHIFPQLFPIFLKVAKKYEIKFIRIPHQNLPIKEFPTTKKIILSLFSKIAGNNYNFKKTDYFYGINHKYPIKKVLENLKDGSCELVCHPGFVDKDLQSFSTLTSRREIELKELLDPTLPKIIKKNNIKLVRFKDIR